MVLYSAQYTIDNRRRRRGARPPVFAPNSLKSPLNSPKYAQTAHSRTLNSMEYYMHNIDDKHPTLPGIEPCTSAFQTTTESNEPSGRPHSRKINYMLNNYTAPKRQYLLTLQASRYCILALRHYTILFDLTMFTQNAHSLLCRLREIRSKGKGLSYLSSQQFRNLGVMDALVKNNCKY